MNTKLTLTIEDSVIESAKKYAKSKHSSLSSIIENYLKVLVKSESKKESDDIEVSPLLRSLQGKTSVDADFDYKEELLKALEKKHL
jgi:hypothetical protein